MGNSSTYPYIKNAHDCDNQRNNWKVNVFYFSFKHFCLMISSCLCISLTARCVQLKTQDIALDNGGVLDKSKHFTVYNSNFITLSNPPIELHNITNESNDMGENSISDNLRKLRMQNPKKVVMGHLNINSLPNKSEGIMDIVAENIDVFLISETKIDYSFPEAQFKYNGYGLPHRRDRALGGGGLILFVNDRY